MDAEGFFSQLLENARPSKRRRVTLPKHKAVAPDVAAALGPMLTAPSTHTTPLFSPSDDIPIINTALAHAVAQLNAVPVGSSMGHVPISTVRDDMEQLSWRRVSAATGEPAPLCYFATNKCSSLTCASTDKLHSHGPLHSHFTPTEEARFQAEGLKSVPLDRPCILCERRDLAALIEIHGGLINQSVLHGSKSVWPLCAPLINKPGGYKFEACYPVDNVVGVPVVRADISLTVRNDKGRPYFDQGAAIFGVSASPLN